MQLCVARFLVRVDMPDDVVRETNDFVSGSLGHLCETLRLGLVLEGVGGEVDTCGYKSALASHEREIGSLLPQHTRPVNISLHKDVDTTDAIKLNLLVLVISPVAHFGHVLPSSVVLVVSFESRRISYRTLPALRFRTECRLTFSEYCILAQASSELQALVGLDPGVVVD